MCDERETLPYLSFTQVLGGSGAQVPGLGWQALLYWLLSTPHLVPPPLLVLDQWFSTFLTLRPFNTVPHVVVTPPTPAKKLLCCNLITRTLLMLNPPKGVATHRLRTTTLKYPRKRKWTRSDQLRESLLCLRCLPEKGTLRLNPFLPEAFTTHPR